MKRSHTLSVAILAVLFSLLLSTTAFADSSWVWISETRPHDVLPWVAIATLAIETWMLCHFCKIDKTFKVFCIVVLGNLLSFSAPYVMAALDEVHADFLFSLEHWPYYITGTAGLLVTVAVELPVEYSLLKKQVPEQRQTHLLSMVIAANVLTTVMVAIVERIFCRGHW